MLNKFNKNKIVSVIIPVYNVFSYFNRCMQSVVNQTYKEIQIILVDDGSTDGSGKLCDEWQSKDDRIMVIHQQNEGLSAARNTGLSFASGNYISFIDSDDWIDKNMIYRLLESIEKNNSDMSCCGMYDSDGINCNEIKWFEYEKVFGQTEAMDYLVANKLLTSHVMPKLYRSTIWKNISFPKGKSFEDIYVMHKVFLKSKKISIIPQHLYFYYNRPDSISKKANLTMFMEWINALRQRRKDIIYLKNIYYQELTAQIAVVFSLAVIQKKHTNQELKIYRSEISTCFKELKEKNTIIWAKKYSSSRNYHYCLLAKYFGFNGYYIYKILKKFDNRMK